MAPAPKTDRYVRRGGPIPQIYPGTLAGLQVAIQDTLNASRFMPDRVFYLTAIRDGQSYVIRQFRGGHAWGALESVT